MTKYVNKSGIHPLNKTVLVQVVTINRMSTGGIAIPDTMADKHDAASTNGILVAMGPIAAEYWGDEVSAGDTIVFPKYTGNPKKGKDGMLYRIMQYDDIWAKADGVWDQTTDPRISLVKSEQAELEASEAAD